MGEAGPIPIAGGRQGREFTPRSPVGGRGRGASDRRRRVRPCASCTPFARHLGSAPSSENAGTPASAGHRQPPAREGHGGLVPSSTAWTGRHRWIHRRHRLRRHAHRQGDEDRDGMSVRPIRGAGLAVRPAARASARAADGERPVRRAPSAGDRPSRSTRRSTSRPRPATLCTPPTAGASPRSRPIPPATRGQRHDRPPPAWARVRSRSTSHITDIAVGPGEFVQKGAPFARVSADPPEPHLHFELWLTIDPADGVRGPAWPNDNDLDADRPDARALRLGGAGRSPTPSPAVR